MSREEESAEGETNTYCEFIEAVCARSNLICQFHLDVSTSPNSTHYDKKPRLIVGNGKIDVYFNLVTTADAIVNDLLSILGTNNDEEKKKLPLIYSIEINLPNFRGGSNGENIMNVVLGAVIASCTHINSITITAPTDRSDYYSPRKLSYNFKSSLYDSISKDRYIINAKRLENLLTASPNSECLTQAAIKINNFSQQLVDIIPSSLWNLQSRLKSSIATLLVKMLIIVSLNQQLIVYNWIYQEFAISGNLNWM